MQEEQEEELSDREQLFCYHYVRTWNATQAALKAGYAAESKNKHSAQVLGCRLLQRPKVKQEVNRLRELFKQEIHVDIQDFLAFCLKVIGADIGDYLKFGAIDRLVYDDKGPVKDPDTGEYLKEPVNGIELGESEQLDTSVIQEIKQGKRN
ncbi:MAG: terminase small subunit [Pelosinus sp.]|nr:terminase small subunit [Pelosinus sp.]